ncbi:MAG: DEAD/DEAH box helicase [Fusobacteriaceae bacterium]
MNSPERKIKVLTTIERELKSCDEFFFSVAFVTRSGVAVLIDIFQELLKRGIKGKILVSQYLNFTEPEALKALLKFSNIELKIVTKGGYHAKGYMFKRGEKYNLIVGSSNFTSTAFSTNKEWNLKVSTTKESYLTKRMLSEFEEEFEKSTLVTPEFIMKYERVYKKAKYQAMAKEQDNIMENEVFYRIESEDEVPYEVISENILEPNLMQKEALKSLENLREKGEKKALIISATGTGKTYLSAFHVQKVNPKKFLFVVHRENIARAAQKSFEKVIGKRKSMGVYSGNSREISSDYIFSTIQTISRDEHMKKFHPEHFDYIVIDETHRAGADSYKKIMEYFKPKFLMGMTATPERTDGYNIFESFDYNIAYEIRLQQALEAEMLSPFHYYGVKDIYAGDMETEFEFLNSDERARHIIEKAEFYGCDDGEIRGLVFCSKVEECKIFSKKFNEYGFNTRYLSGGNSEDERRDAINLLESDGRDKIDYIFTVDIFNEGIDIPKVNQVIMVRPTQSAIIFVQQLGRGLRKSEGKNYLTVIDFIGNYKNNYMIPIALFGDNSYNKDTLRNLMVKGNRMIPGSSTISFDEISKKEIFQAIDTAKLDGKKDLTKDYELLKFKIGKIPSMMDFIEHGSRDPYNYVIYSKNSYYEFLKNIKEEIEVLGEYKEQLLKLFSLNIGNGKRIHEILLMKNLMKNKTLKGEEFLNLLYSRYEIDDCENETIDSVLRNLNFDFVRESHEIIGYIEEKKEFYLKKSFINCLENEEFKNQILDIMNYGEYTFNKKYSREKYQAGFILYEKYSRKDVCRILNWELNEEGTVNGYKVREEKNSCPIFVNYHKSEDINPNIAYEDGFIDRHTFKWMSRSQRKLESKEIQIIKNNKKLRIPLFIKKHDGESTDFYYMGDMIPQQESFKQKEMPNGAPVVEVTYTLKYSVQEEIYEYITTL